MPRAALPHLLCVLCVVSLLDGCSALGLIDRVVPRDGYAVQVDQAYGALERQRLDVYRPRPADAGSTPIVVFFHGGRWSFGDKSQYRFAAQALTAQGFVAVLPNYRLYPRVRFPEFVADGAAALAWTCRHARELGGPDAPVFVMGHSAGAHIAGLLALEPTYREAAGACTPAGMIGLAGPYDFLPLKADDLKDIFGPPERYALSQPISYADRPGPPLLLLHGRGDRTVYPKNTRNLAARARAAGTAVETREYRLIGHGGIVVALAAPLRWLAPVRRDVADFIRRHPSPGAAHGS